MKKYIAILIAAIAIAGIVVSLLSRNRARIQIAANDALLQQHEAQLLALVAEQQRLSNLLSRPAILPSKDQTPELQNLQDEVESLRQRTNELAAQRQQVASSPAPPAASETPYPQEYYVELNRITAGKRQDMRALVYSFGWFAKEHEGRIPSSIDPTEIAPYLKKGQMSLTGTNQFEVVYHGSLDELSNVPPQAVAMIRERQPWLAPSGKWARVYGMVANSFPQIVESDDNFQAWEAEHIIPPPTGGR